MADVYEQNLAQKTSLTTSDYIRVVGSDNVSYKQGMRNTIDTIVGNSTVALPSSITDLNDIDTTSIYTIGATVPTNAPKSDGTWSAYVQTFRQSATYKFQVYVFFGTTSEEVYYRKHLNGTWRDWVKQPTRAEMTAVTPVDLGSTVASMLSAFQTAYNSGGTKLMFSCAGGLTNILTKGAESVSGKGMAQLLGDPSGSATNIDFLFYTGSMNLYVARYSTASSSVTTCKKATLTAL